MSGKSPGWVGTTTSGIVTGLVLLVVPGLAQWLFPDWDAFFNVGSKWLGFFWRWLTAEWTLPAVPLVVIVAVALWLTGKLAAAAVTQDAPTAGASVVHRAPPLNFGETIVLRQLFESDEMRMHDRMLEAHSGIPPAVHQAAAATLLNRGLIEIAGSNPRFYALTNEGKSLMVEIWNASQRH